MGSRRSRRSVLGGLAIFRLRRIAPAVARPYSAWGYPVVPAVFVLGLAALVVNTAIEKPRESLIGTVVVALGVPAFWYWRSESKERL